MGGRGTKLVPRIEHHPVAVDHTDPAGCDQLRSRVDPGDLAPAEPDQLDRAGAVVQLALEGRYAAARAERDRPQSAVQRDHLTVVTTGDRPRATVVRVVLQHLGILLVAVPGQSPEGTLEKPPGLVATHGNSVVRASRSGLFLGSGLRPGRQPQRQRLPRRHRLRAPY